MPDGSRKIERGLFESAKGRWRIANPWKLTTELRHRWLVAERDSTASGWCMHDGDHATLHDARVYVEARQEIRRLTACGGRPPMAVRGRLSRAGGGAVHLRYGAAAVT